MYECCICYQHARSTLRHLREVHPHFNGKVPCGVNGCPRTSSSYEGLRQHMYRYHRDILNVPVTSEASDSHEQENSREQENDSIMEDLGNTFNSDPPCYSAAEIGAKFILKTRDGRKLTQLATDGIIEDSKILVQNTVEIIKLKEVMEVCEATENTIAQVNSIFCDETLINPFNGLDTWYKQEKFIKDNFNYVVSTHTHLQTW